MFWLTSCSKWSPLIPFSKHFSSDLFIYPLIYSLLSHKAEKIVIGRALAHKSVLLYAAYVLVYLSIYARWCVLVCVCVFLQQLLYESQSLLRKCIYESVCCCSTPLNCWYQLTPGKHGENSVDVSIVWNGKKKKYMWNHITHIAHTYVSNMFKMSSKLQAQPAVNIWELLIKPSVHFQRWRSD